MHLTNVISPMQINEKVVNGLSTIRPVVVVSRSPDVPDVPVPAILAPRILNDREMDVPASRQVSKVFIDDLFKLFATDYLPSHGFPPRVTARTAHRSTA
jgi:hypothetical protein